MGIALFQLSAFQERCPSQSQNKWWLNLSFSTYTFIPSSLFTFWTFLFFIYFYLQTDVKRKSNIWLDPLGLVLVPCLWWVSKELCEPWKKLWLSAIYRDQLWYTFLLGPFLLLENFEWCYLFLSFLLFLIFVWLDWKIFYQTFNFLWIQGVEGF